MTLLLEVGYQCSKACFAGVHGISRLPEQLFGRIRK